MESHCPQLVPPALLYFSGLHELLLGILASHNLLEFLLTGSSPPNINGLASVAIWANCQVGDDSSDLPTSSSLLVFTLLLLTSPGVGGASSVSTGGSASVGGSVGAACTSTLVLTFLPFPFSSFLGVIFVLAILEWKTNQSEPGMASWNSHDICFELVTMHFKSFDTNSSCSLTHFLMSYEWQKYVKILDR